MKNNFALILSALLLATTVAACSNTLHGAGRDIENAGESVQKNVPAK